MYVSQSVWPLILISQFYSSLESRIPTPGHFYFGKLSESICSEALLARVHVSILWISMGKGATINAFMEI